MLCLLLLGVIEIGRYAYISILVGNAARAGAAYGAQSHAFSSTIQTNIETAAKNDFDNNGQNRNALNVASALVCACDNDGSLTVIACTGTCPTGQQIVSSVQVTASGDFNSLFSYPGIPSPLHVSRAATLRMK
jgi:Flp pilus assembly protein TadG